MVVRRPHFLENRITYGDDVASLTCWPPLAPPRKIVSWYSFLLEAE
jgi:hypothetical protein